MNNFIIPGRVFGTLPCAKKAKEICEIVDGKEYCYTQFIPSGMKPGLPLVVELHGGGCSGTHACRHTAWAELAERENFVVVYPSANAIVQGPESRLWRCQYPDYEKDADYIMEIIDQVCEKQDIDRGRIYVSGMSLGDMMGIIFIAKYGGRIAGLCSFNGPTNPEEWKEKIRLSAQVPVIQIRGELDATLPIPGGCKPPEEDAIRMKREFLVWNRERWMEKNETETIPQIVLGEKLNYALYRGETCDVRYVECKNMGHVEPLYGMELAWKHCFSRYRRTKAGIERLLPADDLKTAPELFALAAGCAKVYTALGVQEIDTAPVLGEPEQLPPDFWCTICKDDYSQKAAVYAPLTLLVKLLNGTECDNVVTIDNGVYTFYSGECFVASQTQHFAMEKPALYMEDMLWVPVQEALYVMGYHSAETDGVVVCAKDSCYLTKGFAQLINTIL